MYFFGCFLCGAWGAISEGGYFVSNKFQICKNPARDNLRHFLKMSN